MNRTMHRDHGETDGSKHRRMPRLLAAIALILAVTGAGSLASASSASADQWTSNTATWDQSMQNSHSRAQCVAGSSVNVRLPQNDPYLTVRTDYLYRWNGSAWVYTGRYATATSNGALYFTYYNGAWLYFASSVLLIPSHGYYSVFESVSQNGRVVSSGWFTKYAAGSYYSPDVSYCTL